MKVYTEERKAYELCADTLGEGGESKIYHVQGDPSVCAKIYKTVKPEQEAKLRAMVNERFNGVVDGHLLIAWPQHLLYDGNGNFVGYLMPFQKGSPLFMVNRPEERDRVFRTPYNWSYAVAVAYNIASIVAHTHEMGYVVGDMNNANFLVDDNGIVTIIDVDSFEFTDKTGHHFRTGVGLPEYVAPELQGRNLSKNNFTIATDNFALAVHIFILPLTYLFAPETWQGGIHTLAQLYFIAWSHRVRISSAVQSTRSRVWSHFSRISLMSIDLHLIRIVAVL